MTVSYASALLVNRGYDIQINPLSLPDIELCRNLFLSVWYEKSTADYIWFVDDDMEFNPDLALAQLDLDEPVVGAIYPKKAYPISFVFNGDLSPDKRIEHPKDKRFCQVDGMGFGATMIRRDAIDKMLENGLLFQTEHLDKLGINATLTQVGGLSRMLLPFKRLQAPEGFDISEDLSFCKRWRQTGGVCWAAQGWEIGHVGPNVWRGQFDRFGVDNGKLVYANG